jgi:hypothetical protein
MKLGMCIMATESIAAAHFINASHLSVCLYLYPPPFGDRQRLGKHVPAAVNTRNNRKIVGRVNFYAVRVLSKESQRVCLYPPVVTRQLGKDVPRATKNSGRRHFLCFLLPINSS